MGLGVLGGLVTLPQGTAERATFERFRAGIWFEWAARKGFLTTWLRIGQERVMVVNTHLIANHDQNSALDNHYARVQLAELSQLGAPIRRLPDDEPLIVAGGFNVPAGSPQFADFMNGCGLCSTIDRSVHSVDGHAGSTTSCTGHPAGAGWRARPSSAFRNP